MFDRSDTRHRLMISLAISVPSACERSVQIRCMCWIPCVDHPQRDASLASLSAWVKRLVGHAVHNSVQDHSCSRLGRMASTSDLKTDHKTDQKTSGVGASPGRLIVFCMHARMLSMRHCSRRVDTTSRHWFKHLGRRHTS